MRKSFEDLTIADDFMFCEVMEYAPICKEFLEILFSVKIEKITYLSPQNTVTANSRAKTVRLDVLVKDKASTSYDIEMYFPIDVRVYRKTRVLPFGKTSLLLTGCQWFQAVASFSVEKLAVQECARTHILERWHPCRIGHTAQNIEHCSPAPPEVP